ncbi:MAG: TonB-dependent receptor [Geminicoccaceae bacterium]|nr:TonB-dependent receptor [Geminicoccaceae bacterium]MCS7267365.1 TonB-dependent receptor [Geminicoccaceae bacterium]MCX7630302.1 TonB-dependent receptor [Geminicoccaceae bacterium]MDW8123588.1 TonB-dependent receptor [Geminicoccaceae bacterium]MDW8339929.1 TonB-dependent receptor [Geminicoccaceae bacterium]
MSARISSLHRSLLATASAFAALLVGGAGASARDVARLPELVVTATRYPVTPETVGSALTVLTAEDLATRQSDFVLDILRDVPGLEVSAPGPRGSLAAVRIRGAESNHTLVVIDGVKMNDPAATGTFRFEDLRAADIERIEILRGPQATLYGSNTIGGVIAITTRRGKGRPELRVSALGGSFGTGEGAVSIGGGNERFDAYLGISGIRSEGTNVAARGGEDDGYRQTLLNANLGLRPLENLEIRGFLRWLRAENDYDDFGPDTREGFLVPTDADLQDERSSLSGRLQAKLSLFEGQWEHTLGISALSTKSDQIASGTPTFRFDAQRTIVDYQTTLLFDTPALAGASHGVTLLAEWQRDDAVSSFAEFEATDNLGLVGDYRVTLFDRLTLSAGVRYDENEKFEDFVAPRLTAAFAVPETGTKLRASWGRGIQNPSLTELYGFFANFRGNPDLEPEQSAGWDVGIEQSLFAGRLALSVGYFRNEIEKFIGTEFDPGTGTFRPVNLPGEVDTRGIETALAARLLDDLELRAAYTFLDTDGVDGRRLVRRSPHIASLGLTWRFAPDADGRRRGVLDLAARYNGSQKDTVFTPAFFSARRTLDDFWLLQASASYEISPGVVLFGRIENLLDEEYEEAWGYRGQGLAVFLGIESRFGP